jgi:two-component system, OmpR family, response regulator
MLVRKRSTSPAGSSRARQLAEHRGQLQHLTASSLIGVPAERFGEDVWRQASQVIEQNPTLSLAAMEFQVLQCLMCNPGRMLSKPENRDQVWHHDFGSGSSLVEIVFLIRG